MHVIAICAYSYSRNSEDSVSNAVILASDVTAQSSDASIFEPHENAWHSTEAARDYDDGDVGRLIICAGMSQIAPSEPPSNAINIPSLTEASAVAAPATGNGGFWAQVSTNSLFTAVRLPYPSDAKNRELTGATGSWISRSWNRPLHCSERLTPKRFPIETTTLG